MTQTDFSELQVPNEPGVYLCARHKNVQTRLRCGRCEKPICPKCTVMGPTGARCRDCGSNKSSHMYQVKPWHYAATFFATMILCAIGSALIGAIGFFVVFFAPAIGTGIGKAIVWVTRGKRGSKLAWTATAGAVAGALGPVLLSVPLLVRIANAPQSPYAANVPLFVISTLGSQALWPLVFLALAIPAIWYWLK